MPEIANIPFLYGDSFLRLQRERITNEEKNPKIKNFEEKQSYIWIRCSFSCDSLKQVPIRLCLMPEPKKDVSGSTKLLKWQNTK